MADLCMFANCENEVKYPNMGVCGTCYSGMRLWTQRPPAERRKRLGQYQRMQERMEYIMDGRGTLPGYTKKQRTPAKKRNTRRRR